MNLLSSLADTAQPEGEVWFLYIRILQKWILSGEVASWQKKNVEKCIVSVRDEKRNTHLRQATMQTPLCSASSWHCKKKKKRHWRRPGKKYACAGMGVHVNSFLSNFLQIVQNTHRLSGEIVHKTGLGMCYVSSWYLILFFKSLISPTPFPKIVPPFAYLQCDNGAVWNNMLSRVYRWAALIFSSDKTKSVNSWKRGGEIYNSYRLY